MSKFDPHIPPEEEDGVGLFGWVRDLYYLDDLTILNRNGLDAVMYLKFERYSLRLLFLVSLVSAVVLVPVNNTGTFNREISLSNSDIVYLRGFNDWLVTNIRDASRTLWVHLVVFIIVCVMCFALILQYTRDFYLTRKYFNRCQGSNLQVHASSTTVLIRSLPLQLRTPEPLKQRIEAMYPNEVRFVFIQFDCSVLIKLRDKQMNAMVALDAAKGALMKSGKRPTKAKGKWPVWLGGAKVDAITALEKDLKDIKEKIKIESQKELKVPFAFFFFFLLKNNNDFFLFLFKINKSDDWICVCEFQDD